MTDSSPDVGLNHHLALLHDESIPEDMWDQFCRDIETEQLDLVRRPMPSRGPQAGVEAWLFPAILIFIAKRYFDGFLQEAGRKHYEVLEKALSQMWKRLFGRSDGFRVVVFRSDGEVKTEFSPLFAIYGQVRKGLLLKLVFREGCSEEEYGMAIQMFLQLLDSHHRGEVRPDAEIALDREQGAWGQVVVAVDRETETLRVVRLPGEARRAGTERC